MIGTSKLKQALETIFLFLFPTRLFTQPITLIHHNMDKPASAQQYFRFLDLPQELQLSIIRYHYSTRTITNTQTVTRSGFWRIAYVKRTTTDLPDSSLLCANRYLHDLAKPLRDSSPIKICIHQDCWDALTRAQFISARTWMSPEIAANVVTIHHLGHHEDVTRYWQERRFPYFALTFPKLQKITFSRDEGDLVIEKSEAQIRT